jgi:hypothetical protein
VAEPYLGAWRAAARLAGGGDRPDRRGARRPQLPPLAWYDADGGEGAKPG